MDHYPTPHNEQERLANLALYSILDTPEENDFDELASLAAAVCDCPIAAITFIDEERQWFKAAVNISKKEISRSQSFCAHTITGNGIMVIKDARLDERFSNYPSVQGDGPVIFYAGVPVISPAGHALGTVCVMGNKEDQPFTSTMERALQSVANQVCRLMELRIKNKLYQQKSELIAGLEKKFEQLESAIKDAEKQKIELLVHQSFGRKLNGVKIYLDYAEKSKDLKDYFLRKSSDSLRHIINDVKHTTKSLLPEADDTKAGYIQLISEMAQQFGTINNMQVQVTFEDDLSNLKPTIILLIFKVLENQLQLAKRAQAKNVNVVIKNNTGVYVVMEDDGITNEPAFPDYTTLYNINYKNKLPSQSREVARRSSGFHNTIQIRVPSEIV